MPDALPSVTSPLMLVQLQARMRQELRHFRKITGLIAVTSLANSLPESGTQFLLAPPVHPQCARRIRRLRRTPCGDQWLAHVRNSRRSPRARSHECPIGMRCACVPIHFGDHLVGVGKLVAAPTTPDSAFAAAMGVLELIVSKTCLHLTVSGLTEQVLALQGRVNGFEQFRTRGGGVGTPAARTKNPPISDDSVARSIQLVNRALAYLQAHYRNPVLTLPEIASALGCNPRYLTTRFTQVVGEHMRTHLLALRVTHACRLLIGTDLRVKEIAYESGFPSAERLGTTFRRQVGVSPLDYRRIFSDAI
jgi:AraC-like DNA-binding protein